MKMNIHKDKMLWHNNTSQEGMKPKTLQMLPGHSNIGITMLSFSLMIMSFFCSKCVLMMYF